eukprot:scaffold32214_cov61-Phaeocystis_antarctica.AAC.12
MPKSTNPSPNPSTNPNPSPNPNPNHNPNPNPHPNPHQVCPRASRTAAATCCYSTPRHGCCTPTWLGLGLAHPNPNPNPNPNPKQELLLHSDLRPGDKMLFYTT